MKKKVVISWSSGKDSTLTLERLLNDPSYEVVGLYTTYVGDEVPFQVTPLSVVEMQAKLIGLPLISIELPEVFPANDIYQSTIINALKQSNLEIDAVAFGDMFCNGIADYRRSYIEPASWECVFPLMGQSSSDLADEIINLGIRTWLVTVDGHALDSKFCGELYTKELLAALPEDVDPCGEDGEFHTLVTHAPCFKGYLEINKTAIEMGDRFTHQRYKAILHSE